MRYITEKEFQLCNTAVTLGKFDGLHIGHRALLGHILGLREKGYESVVFTFSLHPFHLFSKREVSLIYSEEEKKHILENMGIDALISYPFTKETAKMEPEKFIKDILVRQLDAKVIVVGSNFCFGHNRKGNVELLKKMSEQYNYEVIAIDKVKIGQTIVSSSIIREELVKGNMKFVNQMLGEPYCIKGKVVHGKKIGRTLGMPTINLVPEPSKLLPPNGVYVSGVRFDNKDYGGITNIGYKPTVSGDRKIGVETYIFNFSGDLYGKVVEVSLYDFERGEVKFDSLQQLKEMMQKDMEYGKKYFEREQIGFSEP